MQFLTLLFQQIFILTIRAALTQFLLGTILGFMIAAQKRVDHKPTWHQVLLSKIKSVDNI